MPSILNNNVFANNFIVLDETFEVLIHKTITYSGIYTTRGRIKFNNDSTKIYSCGFQTYNGNLKGYIATYNLEGDSLGFFNVGNNTFDWRVTHVMEMPDHTLLAVGGRSKFPSGNANPWDEYPLAMKIDTLGNVIWTKLYTHTNRGLNLGVQQTLDGNYLISSFTFFNSGAGTGSVYRPTLIKIDSSGNELWHRLYGPEASFSNGFTNIFENSDSSFFCASSYGISNNPDDEVKRFTLLNISKNGEIISETINEDLEDSFSVLKIIKSPSGFYLCGWQFKPNDINNNNIYGSLLKTNLFGNILENKKFNFTSTSIGDNRFYDFTQTPDSGFLCVGSTQYFSTDSVGPYRAWLVKTDKYGCIIADCQLTGLEEEKSKNELNIFPNPSQGNFYINSEQEIKLVSVFTINGKKILQQNCNSTFFKIDLTGFSQGVYFVEVQTEKETLQRKIVKIE